MSEIARAMINTSVASIFLRLRKRTTITRRLRKKLTSTAMQSTMSEGQIVKMLSETLVGMQGVVKRAGWNTVKN